MTFLLSTTADHGFTGLTGFAADLLNALGEFGVGVLVFIEVLVPPIPSEVILPFAGYLSQAGELQIAWLILWSTAASLAGALLLYWLGAAWGLERICALADRIPLMHADDVRRAVAWFGRHGRTAVFVGRLVPGVRSLISIPAGIDRMPLLRFCVFTTAGSLVWNAALILAGYELGAQWHVVEGYVGPASSTQTTLLAGPTYPSSTCHCAPSS